MTNSVSFLKKVGFGAASFVVATGAAYAFAAPQMERGSYEVKQRGGGPAKRLCVANVDQLVQIAHPGKTCKRFTINSGANTLTVSYDCGAGNSGQTTIKTETARLAQVDTQGMLNNMPFNDSYEVRKVGECPA